MKNINDDRLANVEKFVRDNGPKLIEWKLKDPNNDGVTKEKMLLNIYGDTYNLAPEKFCFRDDDRMLIKELVDHVKNIVDGNGINSGLHLFKIKVKKPRQYRLPKAATKITHPMGHGLKIENENIENTNDFSELKSETCLIYHGADDLADIDHLDDTIIHVTIRGNTDLLF